MMPGSRVQEIELETWTPEARADRTDALCRELERGNVLYMPRLRFGIDASESRFLAERWAAEGTKNISLRHGAGAVRGAHGAPGDLAELRAMLARYAACSEGLLDRLLARYTPWREAGSTSFRPCPIASRALGDRKDDRRLHVDSFPSNPVRGRRILRVFSNVHPTDVARTWQIGEPFPLFANRFMPRARAPLPGLSWLLERAGVTKSRRSAYDHYMLRMHDEAKSDELFQRTSPRETFRFAAGSTWIAFTDCVVHAALEGQHAFEQTFYVGVEAMIERGQAPLAILEQLAGRALV